MLFAVVGDRAEVAVEGDGQRRGRDLVGKGVVGRLVDIVVVIDIDSRRRRNRFKRSDIVAYCLGISALEIGDLVFGFDDVVSVVAVEHHAEDHAVICNGICRPLILVIDEFGRSSVLIRANFRFVEIEVQRSLIDGHVDFFRSAIEVIVARIADLDRIRSGMQDHISNGSFRCGNYLKCLIAAEIFVYCIVAIDGLEVVAGIAERRIEVVERPDECSVSEFIYSVFRSFELNIRLGDREHLPSACFGDRAACTGDIFGVDDIVVVCGRDAEHIISHIHDGRSHDVIGCLVGVGPFEIVRVHRHIFADVFRQVSHCDIGELRSAVVRSRVIRRKCEGERARSDRKCNILQRVEIGDRVIRIACELRHRGGVASRFGDLGFGESAALRILIADVQ